MYKIGLTGSPGAGKTSFAAFFEEKGIPVVSGDELGREVIDTIPEVLGRLAAAFGPDIIRADGTLDRRLTAGRAFSSEENTRRLNEIVHPHLLRLLREKLRDCRESGAKMVLVDAALIPEWGITDWFDVVIAVVAPEELRIRRLLDSGLSEKEALDRMKAQFPQEKKSALADIVVENTGSLPELKARFDEIYDELVSANAGQY